MERQCPSLLEYNENKEGTILCSFPVTRTTIGSCLYHTEDAFLDGQWRIVFRQDDSLQSSQKLLIGQMSVEDFPTILHQSFEQL